MVASAKDLKPAIRRRERVAVRGRAVHLLYDVPYHRANLSNAFVEKTLGTATNRNVNVIKALKEKWSP